MRRIFTAGVVDFDVDISRIIAVGSESLDSARTWEGNSNNSRR